MHPRTRLHRRTGSRRRCPVRSPGVLSGLVVCGIAAAVVSDPLGAQTVLPHAAQLPASTRAMALGDSYQPGSGHADAIFYHPALLERASGFGLDWQRWSTESSAAAASAAVDWLGGTVGVGLRSLQYGAPDLLIEQPLPDDLFESGVPVSERIATLGYSRDFYFGLDVGVTMDLVDQRLGSDVHGVALFDVGIARDVGEVIVALSAQGIGEKPIFDTGDEPARYTLGAGNYGRPVGPLDVGFAAHLSLDDEEDLSYGGGIEVGYWPIQGRTFVARLGIQDVPDGSEASPVTMGLAFWGDDITVEWAFRPVGDVDEGGTHRFGLRWR